MRQRHSVERIVLHHGIDRHIAENDAVADVQRRIEGVCANGIARETGRSCERIRMRLLLCLTRADDRRTIRHLDDIGHVTCRGCVQDDVPIRLHIEHLGDEEARIESDRLARLKIDGNIVRLLYVTNQLFQQRDIIALARNVMPAAEVQPLHPIEIFSKLLLDSFKRGGKRIRPLLAERMEVKSVDSLKQVRTKVRNLYPEPRVRRTGVVDRMLLRRALGIDADAAGCARRACRRTEPRPLGE